MAEYSEKKRAQRRAASKRYFEKFEKTTVLLPPGTKERIASTGASCNAFIKEAVMEKLDNCSEKVTKSNLLESDI